MKLFSQLATMFSQSSVDFHHNRKSADYPPELE